MLHHGWRHVQSSSESAGVFSTSDALLVFLLARQQACAGYDSSHMKAAN